MTAILGLLLGAGVLLAASPVLWPASLVRPVRRELRVIRHLRESLAQAGLHSVTLSALAAVSVVLGIAVGALVFALVPVVILAIAAGVLGLVLPVVLIESRARQRRSVTRAIWPDLVDHLVSAVRSGLALPDSLVTLAHTGPADLRESFAVFEREYRATGGFGLAVDSLKTRLADPVADRVLETLRMSRDVGGSELITVLRNLAVYLRQDAAIRSEVEARQSWVINAARLGVAAPWIILVLLSTRPEAAAAYNSTAGAILVSGGVALSAIAYRIMVRIGRMPEEARWFR